MSRIVLSDGQVKVELRTEGNRVLLELDNSEQVTFALSRSNIQAILDGETIQVSHRGIFCKMSRIASIIHVYFAWKTRHEHVTCSAGDLEALISLPAERQKEA
jgi:hypothetical protein